MIDQMPIQERPRERCLLHGPAVLSLRECLAIILGTGPVRGGCLGVASAVLERVGHGLPSPEEERAVFERIGSDNIGLEGIEGLGEAGYARILVLFEFARRFAVFRESRFCARQASVGPHDGDYRHRVLAAVTPDLRSAAREWIGFVPIYGNEKVGHFCLIERGGRAHVNFDPADLFSRLLAVRPAQFVLIHNHPSGALSPSTADRRLTQQVADLGDRLGTRLLGHAIVSARGHCWVVV